MTTPAKGADSLPFDNTYARLPAAFYTRTNPTPVAQPYLIQLNDALARTLNLDPDFLRSPEGVAILAGNRIAPGSEPLALAYAGHQFAHFVPQLGDGRAILLGEVFARDGRRFDIQLKGSGRTPFSRGGDGRAALGPVLREYLLSEAMHALGVPSTRALAAVLTGEPVQRENPLPGAIFTRVASSHLRVGTFEFFAVRRDLASLRTLTNYAIARHYPEAASAPRPARAFLDAVVSRHARLTAQWMLLGFIHGVMNTDNSSISGETIDFGPCAFLEAYDPSKVFSSIDRIARYAFGNQPRIDLWNLTRLAEALLPVLAEQEGSEESALASAKEALAAYAPQYEAAHLAGLRRKLGLLTDRPEDQALADDLLTRMAANQADFTLTFRRLAGAAADHALTTSVSSLFTDPSAFDSWAIQWQQRLALEPTAPEARAAAMRSANPLVIPRNHLVEAVITAAIDREDFQPFHDLLAAVTNPFEDRPNLDRYTAPATPAQAVQATFCGT